MNKTIREEFDIQVKTYDGKPFIIRAVRLVNKDKQPLILWEGFYHNGFFFDLMENEGSIGEYMNGKGYDVWIINSRGNGGSTGRRYPTSMDDFASIDIPAVINFVFDKTGIKSIYVGHSQGGNIVLMSMMGACKTIKGEVYLSDQESQKRQGNLKAFVILGSYLDFTFSKHSSLQEFVRNGIVLNSFGKKIKLVSSTSILKILSIFNRLPIPVPFGLREAMIKSAILRVILLPLTITLNIISLLKIWEFLYHIPNVTKKARIYLFYRTMQATYFGILYQYHQAIMYEKMMSVDKNVNYSENYHKLTLPISVVTMEYDTLADPKEIENKMFPKLGSKQKYYTEWMGQGHEDFAMNSSYFQQLADAIKILNL